MKRLDSKFLKSTNRNGLKLGYSPSAHRSGIVHIGIGAFHRGHQAVYTDDAIAKFGGNWRIIGVSLRSDTVAKQLNPQDGLYTVTESSPDGKSTRIIGSIEKVLIAPQDPQKVIDAIASESVHIVTMTVTEKGYHFDATKGALNSASADMMYDIANPSSPKTMPGFIVAACKKRMLSHGQKLSVISCDNLSENGQVCQQAVMELAKKNSSSVAAWIKHNVAFCSSMVDRIVPAVTDEHRQRFSAELGFSDEGMILTEPFKQWVIENNLCTPCPRWEEVGVLFVNKVADFEKLKLRTLNGTHSLLAYSGALLGYKWIHEAASDPLLLTLAFRQMRDEMQDTFPVPIGFKIEEYQQTIIDRFKNDEIPYATHQVAMDGSQKIIQRLLYPAIELLDNDRLPIVISAALACWIRYLQGKDEAGVTYEINDPMSDQLESIVARYLEDPKALINTLYRETSIFPNKLVENERFTQTLIDNLTTVQQDGVRAFLQTL